jgi:protein translocase SecG subunit
MIEFIRIAQIGSSLLLITLILLQQRGGGVSGIFGGVGGEFYGTRRGLEKWVFIATIVIAAIFVASALAGLVVK